MISTRGRTRRLVHRFFDLPARRRALLVEAALSLLVARAEARLIPFSRTARRLGGFVSPADGLKDRPGGDPAAADPSMPAMARDVAWAVRAAARHLPFRAVCLTQALAAHAMLRRRGVRGVVHFGAAGPTSSDALDAHAWLEAAGVEVTGYPIPADMVEIARFI